MRTIVTKSEFAERKGRSPSAISHWIASGKITRTALIGSGNRAKIWVEQAERDLAASLDLGQQLAQARPAIPFAATNGGACQEPFCEPRAGDPAADSAAAIQGYAERERRARAIKAEEDALAAQLRNAKEEGRWIEAHKAEQAWGRHLARLLADFDGFLTGPLARELAEAHGLDFKALAVEIREIARRYRTQIAERAAEERASVLEGQKS